MLNIVLFLCFLFGSLSAATFSFDPNQWSSVEYEDDEVYVLVYKTRLVGPPALFISVIKKTDVREYLEDHPEVNLDQNPWLKQFL